MRHLLPVPAGLQGQSAQCCRSLQVCGDVVAMPRALLWNWHLPSTELSEAGKFPTPLKKCWHCTLAKSLLVYIIYIKRMHK